jgi:hypothetical protein
MSVKDVERSRDARATCRPAVLVTKVRLCRVYNERVVYDKRFRVREEDVV